eukprot:2720304-Rhodomonas_salina.1
MAGGREPRHRYQEYLFSVPGTWTGSSQYNASEGGSGKKILKATKLPTEKNLKNIVDLYQTSILCTGSSLLLEMPPYERSEVLLVGSRQFPPQFPPFSVRAGGPAPLPLLTKA